MLQTLDTFRVRVGATIKTYPGDVAGFGEHLAAGQRAVSLVEAKRLAREFFAANPAPTWIVGVDYWVTLDDSGLAYRVTFRRGSRTATIAAAAPLPGPNNLRDLYDAAGYAEDER